MATLQNYLISDIRYDSTWGIWAKKVNGKFDLQSQARFGQFVFENGGMHDDYELVGNCQFISDSREEYCGSEEDCEDFYEEWAIQFLEEMNSVAI